MGRRDERKGQRNMERRSGERRRNGEERERPGTKEHPPHRERRTERSSMETGGGTKQRSRSREGRKTPTGKALGIKILYTNAQSLISKIDELGILAIESEPDFIMLTETWCNNTIEDALLTIPGYGMEIRKDREDTAQGIGGGLIVYARKGWRLEEEEKTNDFSQHCKFKVKCEGVELKFILIYRSPNAQPEATDKLIEIIEKVERNTFLIGDFN